MAFIGKNIIENLTTAMYENPLVIYREYIQNSADSIDKAIEQHLISMEEAEIKIEIDKSSGYIIIEDNGIGIKSGEFKGIMGSIADSSKNPAEDKGFRGIGRLGGISACHTLKFSCTAYGEDVASEVIWDAAKIKGILNDVNQNPDASHLVDEVTAYSQSPCEKEKHFFRVELISVEKSSSELLDEAKVKQYLQNVAPLPYSNTFIFSEKIHMFASKHGFTIDEYNVLLNGERIFKNYKTRLYEEKSGKRVSYDEIKDLAFEIYRDEEDEVICWLWYGISRFEKQIPIINEMRGLRLRKGNIQIGNERVFLDHDFFKESRGYLYMVGEVFAVHKDLRPNARRDYFNINECCRVFEEKLKGLLYDKFYTYYQNANKYKKALQAEQNLAQAKSEYQKKEEKGFISQEEQKEQEEKIRELGSKAVKAAKEIEARESKVKDGDVLQTIYAAIKEEYTPQSLSEDDKQQQKPEESASALQSDTAPKAKHKYISQGLTKYSKKEQKLVGKIYSIIGKILPHDTAELVIDKIQEELNK